LLRLPVGSPNLITALSSITHKIHKKKSKSNFLEGKELTVPLMKMYFENNWLIDKRCAMRGFDFSL
jgi:hypothetical protein